LPFLTGKGDSGHRETVSRGAWIPSRPGELPDMRAVMRCMHLWIRLLNPVGLRNVSMWPMASIPGNWQGHLAIRIRGGKPICHSTASTLPKRGSHTSARWPWFQERILALL